jgi:hypothetical protein
MNNICKIKYVMKTLLFARYVDIKNMDSASSLIRQYIGILFFHN